MCSSLAWLKIYLDELSEKRISRWIELICYIPDMQCTIDCQMLQSYHLACWMHWEGRYRSRWIRCRKFMMEHSLQYLMRKSANRRKASDHVDRFLTRAWRPFPKKAKRQDREDTDPRGNYHWTLWRTIADVYGVQRNSIRLDGWIGRVNATVNLDPEKMDEVYIPNSRGWLLKTGEDCGR